MKKFIIIVVILLVIGGIIFFVMKKKAPANVKKVTPADAEPEAESAAAPSEKTPEESLAIGEKYFVSDAYKKLVAENKAAGRAKIGAIYRGPVGSSNKAAANTSAPVTKSVVKPTSGKTKTS